MTRRLSFGLTAVIAAAVLAASGLAGAPGRLGADRALHAAPPGGESAEPPTIADYLRIKSPMNPSLSPDGALYFRWYPDGVYQVYRLAPGKPQAEAEALTAFPDGANGFVISPDGNWVAITAATGGSEQNDIYLWSAKARTLELILRSPNVAYGTVVWRRDSKAFAYRANDVEGKDFHVYVYDLATRRPASAFADSGSNEPADWSADGKRLAVLTTVSSTSTRLVEVDLAGGERRALSPAGKTSLFAPVGYGPGDTDFVVISDWESDRTILQRIERATGRIVPLARAAEGAEIDAAAWSTDRSVLAVLANEEGYRKLHLRAMPKDAPLAGPAIPEGYIDRVSIVGRDLIYQLSNAQTPGITYRWSLARPSEAPVPVTRADLAGVDVAAFRLPELVRYPSFDETPIPAFLYLPAGATAGRPIPFIVSYHGGPEEQFRPSFHRAFQYFLSRGIGVLAPNVRGSAGYGTAYLKADDYKNRMVSVKDGVAAAQWLVDRGYSERGRLAAHGGSYGGFMAMAMVTEAPDLWAAACNQFGIVNFVSFLENTKDYRRALREAEYGPLTDPDFLRSISPITKVDRIRTPILMEYGLNDPRVPFGEALQLALALKKQGVPVEQLYFPDEGHGLAKEENRILFYEELARFFEAHLLR